MKKSKRYIKKQSKESLINKKVLNKIIITSDICKYAIRELNIAGFNDKSNEFNTVMYNRVIEAIAVFASHGNSDYSARIETNLVNKLCKFEAISPLTFKDEEWNEIGINDYQNNRCNHIFKSDERIYDIHAFTNKIIRSKYFGKDEFEDNNENLCWNGGFFVTRDNILTGEYIDKAYIKDYDIKEGKYVVRDTIKLKATEIEVTKNDWAITVDRLSVEMLLLEVYYDIEPIIIDSIKDVHINDLTYEQLFNAKEYICNINKINYKK